jgi:WXG100 family type VII secretion target
MADIIAAGDTTLADGAKAVNEAKLAIDDRIKKVRLEIGELGGVWTGAAASSFTQMMNAWDEKATKLNNVLVNLEDALRGTEKDQAASEEAHQQAISGISSMMNG